ncbi:MAG: D-sedoheptulose 7-phosphate isomerase [SAR324 cluster bacterium]|nr:D-sedoheptulose 7-phosphate isomerase [SAR324 cluster bacterium]
MADIFLTSQIENNITLKQQLLADSNFLSLLQEACDHSVQAYKQGNKLLIAGNGGSAADAQHIAGELVSRFYFDRPALAAIALTTDTSILTAIGNDYGYEKLFSRQIEGNGVKGDVFLAISTSGNSPNIVNAIETAKSMGIFVIGLTGSSGGKMGTLCDLCLKMPSNETPRIQEGHILVGHLICSWIEHRLFSKNS